jgi:choline-sulfatase
MSLFSWQLVIASIAALLIGGSQPRCALALGPVNPAVRPNILIIIADDHGANTLGIDGDPRRATPNLDALARQGVWFDRAYCNSPLCTPSRQSLITGKLPHSIGVTQLATRLSDSVLTMGEWFSTHDYETIAIGKMHFNGHSTHGFAIRIDSGDWETHLTSHPILGGDHRRPWRPFRDPAREWLNADTRSAGLPIESMESSYFVDQAIQYLLKKHDKPVAMIVGFYDPHSPFRFPTEWKGRFRPSEFLVPPLSEEVLREQPAVFAALSPNEIRGIQAAYFTSLSFLDGQVGRLIQAIDRAGISDQTLVVYVGDNGYMLGQHGRFEKHCFYEPAVRIPFIIRWPGRIRGNRRISDLVEMVDILPTVLHLMQLPCPPGLQGIDLVPLLRGKVPQRARDVVFSEYLENEEAMVRSARHKLIVGTGRRLRQDGYKTTNPLPLPGPYQRLYDLEVDPAETTDLSVDPLLTPIREALLNALHERLVSTRQGLEPVPDGMSRRDAIHWCLVPRDR